MPARTNSVRLKVLANVLARDFNGAMVALDPFVELGGARWTQAVEVPTTAAELVIIAPTIPTLPELVAERGSCNA